jgi:hypothetical protein
VALVSGNRCAPRALLERLGPSENAGPMSFNAVLELAYEFYDDGTFDDRAIFKSIDCEDRRASRGAWSSPTAFARAPKPICWPRRAWCGRVDLLERQRRDVASQGRFGWRGCELRSAAGPRGSRPPSLGPTVSRPPRRGHVRACGTVHRHLHHSSVVREDEIDIRRADAGALCRSEARTALFGGRLQRPVEVRTRERVSGSVRRQDAMAGRPEHADRLRFAPARSRMGEVSRVVRRRRGGRSAGAVRLVESLRARRAARGAIAR